jgi:hypothetical protein
VGDGKLKCINKSVNSLRYNNDEMDVVYGYCFIHLLRPCKSIYD